VILLVVKSHSNESCVAAPAASSLSIVSNLNLSVPRYRSKVWGLFLKMKNENGTLLRIFDLDEPGGSRICIYVKAIIIK
jgi:hypothetical protein